MCFPALSMQSNFSALFSFTGRIQQMLIVSACLALLGGCSQQADDDFGATAAERALADRIQGLEASSVSSSGKRLELAVLLHANGREQEALGLYQKVIEASGATPEMAASHFYSALIQTEAGDAAAAREHFQAVLEEFPMHSATLYRLGEMGLKEGRWELSKQWFLRLLEQESDNPYALLECSRCMLAQGDSEDALGLLERMHRNNPAFKGGLGLLAQLLEDKGRIAEAAKVRQKITSGAVSPFPDVWLDTLRKATYDVQKLGVLYEEHKNAKNLKGALWYLSRIEELEPNNWNAKLLKGILFAEEGQLSAALGLYRQSIEVGADQSLVAPLLVKCLLLLSRPVEAERYGLEALASIPNSVDLLIEIAGVKIVQYDFDSAVSYFKRALELDPYNAKALRFYSEMLVRQGKLREGFVFAKRLAQVDKTNPASLLSLALVCIKLGESEEALINIRGAESYLVANEKTQRSLLVLAGEFRERLKREDALYCLELLLAMDPENEAALVIQTELLVQLKRAGAAVLSMRSLVALDPSDIKLRIALGEILSMGGDAKQAEEEWRSALMLADESGQTALRREIMARLRSL